MGGAFQERVGGVRPGAVNDSGGPNAAQQWLYLRTKLRLSSMGCLMASTKKSLASQPLADHPLTSQQLVNVHQAKTQLSQLLQEVEQGQEVVIARSGVPIARLVAWQAPVHAVAAPGAMGGQITLADDFDAPLGCGE